MPIKSVLFSRNNLYVLLFLSLFLAWPATADETDKSALGGFLSARLGSSAEEVLIALKKDGIEITQDEIQNGARQIRGKHKGHLSTNKIIYVIPEKNKKLALIIEFYDNPDHHQQVIEGLTKQLGKSLGKEITQKTLQEGAGKFPPGIKELTMWAIKAGDINLMVRAMRFDNYLAVERLDARLL